jgi:probable addiction module antidote protein
MEGVTMVRKAKTQAARFDAAEFLDNEALIADYLSVALEEDDPAVFLAAVAAVARARGMTRMARDTGLGRESLYKALSPGATPRYDTVLRLVRAMGIKLRAAA